MRYTIIIGVSCLSFAVQANVLQYITGISYSNPAELFKIKDHQFILGATGAYTDAKFQGRALNFNTFQYDYGKTYSSTPSLLPYGRIAHRFNSRLIFGVDVTQPFYSNLNWKDNAFTRYSSIQTLLIDTDISPRLAFSINQQWHLGLGLNFNFLSNNEANWALPVSQIAYAKLINRSSSFGTGYNLGTYYNFNQSNFFGVSYFSRIHQNTRGTSFFNTHIENNFTFSFNMPATLGISYVHIFNAQWLAFFQAYQSQWKANQYVRFINTAASPSNFTFAMKFKNSWAYQVGLRHQLQDGLGLTGIGIIDYGPERNELRTLNFPSYTQYFGGLMIDYSFNKKTSIALLYGYGFSNPFLDNTVTLDTQTLSFVRGKVNIRANVLDLRIKVEA